MNYPIHIVIPTHGRPDLLKRTLDSLAECRIPDSLVRTVVIENGGTPNAEQVVVGAAAKLKASYRFTPQGNKSAALNLVLPDIEDGLVVFFDDDIRLAPHVLEAYVSAASRFGEGHFFGGPFGVDYEQEPPQWLKRYLTPCALGWEPEPDNWVRKKGTTDFVGFNWAVFASDLAQAGPFNPDVGPSCVATGQESDMQIRLRAKGIKPQYVEAAKVWHYVPASRCSPEWTIARAYRSGAGSAMVERKQRSAQLKFIWKSLTWNLSPLWVLRRAISRYATNEQTRFKAAHRVARRRAMLDVMK